MRKSRAERVRPGRQLRRQMEGERRLGRGGALKVTTVCYPTCMSPCNEAYGGDGGQALLSLSLSLSSLLLLSCFH